MGNYFGISTSKNNVCMKDKNNNIMEAKIQRLTTSKTVVPKLSRFINIVTTECSVDNLYNSYRDSNFSLKTTAWSKLTCCNSTSDDLTHFFNYHTTTLTSSEEDDIDGGSVAIPASTGKLRTLFEPAVSGPVVNSINTFLTRYNPSKQIETSSLFFNFTTVISMVDLYQPSNIAQKFEQNCSIGSNFYRNQDCCMDKVQRSRGLSFFVDLNEPNQRYPLEKEHRFNLFNDCWSDSDGDSLCSFDNHENGEFEDFIVFDQDCDDNYCEFRISVNTHENNPLHCVNSITAKRTKTINDSEHVSKIQPLGICGQTCETQDQDSKKCHKTSRKVRFETDENLAVVYHMKHWDFAYREARKGPWELAAADRSRFSRRIQDLDSIITPCLQNKLQAIEKCKLKNICL